MDEDVCPAEEELKMAFETSMRTWAMDEEAQLKQALEESLRTAAQEKLQPSPPPDVGDTTTATAGADMMKIQGSSHDGGGSGVLLFFGLGRFSQWVPLHQDLLRVCVHA